MPEGQADIYYLAGEQRSVLEHSPSLEVFRHRGWDVLLLTEPIDEFVIPALADYKGKALKAADRSAPELPAEELKKTEEAAGLFQPLLDALKGHLTELKDVPPVPAAQGERRLPGGGRRATWAPTWNACCRRWGGPGTWAGRPRGSWS